MNSSAINQETLITLTSDIISAHVSNNYVEGEALPQLISEVFGALSALGQEVEESEARPEPAVSIRASVKRDHLVCLEDGKKMTMLKRHLRTDHDMNPDDYRRRWSLPSDYPMVAPDYADKRRELAKNIGLGRKPVARRGRRKKAAPSSES